MTVYKPRSAWTSSARGGAQLTGTKLLGIVWHWPGTSQDVIGAESEAATANRLRGYRNFHVNTRGWSDIGYNHAIDQAGRVWDLRGLGRVGAHCASRSNPDANHEWMGVLLILGDREKPSAAMIRACQDFTHDVFLPRWSRRTRDTGHGRAPGVPGAQTSCPGPFAAELITDDVLTRRSQSPQPQPPEDDMAYRDWPKADRDALAADVAREVHGRSVQVGLDQEPLGVAVGRARNGTRHLLAGQMDPASLAAQLAPLLPSGQSAPSVEDLVEALKQVLGSLDES